MSRDAYEGWDSRQRSRGTDSSPRSHRRRGSGHGDDRQQADGRDDSAQGYGSDVYADQNDYGSRRYAGPEGYGTDGYADYQGEGNTGAGYGSDYQGGYSQDQYSGEAYSGQGYESSGYAGGYADDRYAGGYGSDGTDGYATRDSYPSRDPYATGDYGPADPYAGSGPHTNPHRRDPYDTGGGGFPGPDGYADSAGYGGGPGYAAQNDYGRQGGFADPYASPSAAGYEREGFDEQDGNLYRWRDPQGAVDDPGLARRSRAGREGELDAEDPRHDGFFRGFGGDDDLGGRGKGGGRGTGSGRGTGGGRGQSRGRPPKQRKSHAGLIALFVVLAVFVGIAYTGYHYYSEYKAKHASYVGSGYGSTTILVKQGDTLDSISSQLLHKGVIEAIDPWASYVANRGGLQPGKYKIHIHMSPAATYAALMNPKNIAITKVTIPDGMREVDILPLLAKESGIPLSQFQTAIKDTSALGLPAYAQGNPEGYLYPDTYDIAPGETALKVLQNAVAQFNKEATSLNLAAAAARVGYTPAQIITGASLLEAEASSKYFGDVARVIDNRINQGMDLQLDSTIAYALNKHTDQLTASDKQVNSLYNTFTHKDLPPGPIDSPDAAAIQAFLAPPHGNWLYFITVDKSGTTDFTNDYNQFLTWQAQAKQNGV